MTGLGTAKDGSGKLVGGLTQLQQGAGQLVTGAQQVSDGNAKLAGQVVPVLNKVNAAIPDLQQANADAKAKIDAFGTTVTAQQAAIKPRSTRSPPARRRPPSKPRSAPPAPP